jgi:MoxR-like ATPase
MSGDVERRVEEFRDHFTRVCEEVSRVIVGNDEVIAGVMTCLLVKGHVLLEGIRGLARPSWCKRWPMSRI